MPKTIYLGKKQKEMFIRELMEMQETPIEHRKEVRAAILASDVKINDDVDVIFTNEDDEVRFETKKELLN